MYQILLGSWLHVTPIRPLYSYWYCLSQVSVKVKNVRIGECLIYFPTNDIISKEWLIMACRGDIQNSRSWWSGNFSSIILLRPNFGFKKSNWMVVAHNFSLFFTKHIIVAPLITKRLGIQFEPPPSWLFQKCIF